MRDQNIQDVLDQIKKDLEIEAITPEADIYTEEGLDIEFEDDAITARELAFMRGWNAAH